MNIPEFTAQASLYTTRNYYRSSGARIGDSPADHSVMAAYIPGPETMNRCSGCTDVCVVTRDVCLAKTAGMVAEACWLSLGFGCGAAIALGYIQAASCEASYLSCFGVCNIPSAPELGWKGFCCPKVCGPPTPGIAGSGCCDHGEACVGSGSPNSRDGCCPVGQYCGGNCCAKGEKCCGVNCCPADHYCLDGNKCSAFPGEFGGDPPTPPAKHCRVGADCGPECCPLGLECCSYSAEFGADCRTSCLH